MNVRPARGNVRPSARKPTSYIPFAFPGPSQGWVSDENLALGQPGAAYRLDNIFPTANGGILRRGHVLHAEIPTGTPVKTLFNYASGASNLLFAANDAGIWDVTNGDAVSSVFTLTEGRVSLAQYTNTDGIRFVRGVNGVDAPFVYDGTSFTDTDQELTFVVDETTVPEDLIFTWVFKNRFFFIRKDSLDVFYLPVGQIGGELTKFSLGGVFPKGGSLVFGGTWSQETGGGLSALCVFVTDNGEVAAFQGDNPNDAAAWQRVGVYTIGKPMGPNAFIPRGGDIACCTDVGLVSLSQALLRDAASLSPTSMSKVIGPDWNRYVAERQTKTWQATAWTEGQMLAIALPTASGQSPVWLVSNADTGTWARFTGMDASCLEVFIGGLYFGSPDGNVYQANIGGQDNGLPFVGVYVPSFSQMEQMGRKTVHMARSVIRSRLPVGERLSVQREYRVSLPAAPDAAPVGEPSVWGIARWGTARWGGSSESDTITSRWRNLIGEGEALSIGHQVTSASIAPIDAEFIRTDVLFTVGEVQN